jgi:hypothetical protein
MDQSTLPMSQWPRPATRVRGTACARSEQPRIEKEEHGHGSTNSAWSLSSAIAFQASLDVGWEGWVGSRVIRNAGEFNGFLKPKICLFAEPLRFAEGELILAPRTSPFIRKHRGRIRDYALARADNPTRISLRSGIRPAQNLVDSVRYALECYDWNGSGGGVVALGLAP